MKKHDVRKLYNLPEEVKFCKSCTISNQRPRIAFDDKGVCSACRFTEVKKRTNWEEREKELMALCDRHRRSDGSHDVIVPVSGGKDGGYVAHQLKYKYGMHPLTVTWAPLVPTSIGLKNLESFINVGGFDHILGTPNGKISRILTRLSFIYLGDPFQPFIYGQTNFPLKMAVQHKIPLIIYGENGEVEYGGDMKNAARPTRDIADHNKHYFSGLPPEFWREHGLTDKDIAPYSAPRYEDIVNNKTEIHFFSYYKYWDPQENYYYCTENTGFFPNPERSEGTYSKYASLDDKIDGLHYYLGFIKFGIGRATADSAHEIRDGKIDREEGILLVKKYDGEFPQKYIDQFLEYAGLSKQECDDVLDSWRADHIWKFENGSWNLRHAVWHENQRSI